MGMFDNYPQPDDYIPNNRPKPMHKHEITIMTGETASHTFDVPFDVLDHSFGCANIEVNYKLGLDIVVTKYWSQLEIETLEKHGFKYSSITVHLSPEETSRFHNTLLAANVQMKFVMLDNSIQYSEIYPIKVEDSLDGNQEPGPVPPHPQVNLGFGWTED